MIGGFEHIPVLGLHVPGMWHESSDVQVTAFPAQVPFWHVSVTVHAFPSLHPVPFGALGFEHIPVLGLHVPAWWQPSLAVQVTGVPPHVPFWHESFCVQGLPSLQPVPFGALGFEHIPVLELHVPATWHWSIAVQVPGCDPTQVPFPSQAYIRHAFDPLHGVPTAAGGLEHTPVLELHTPARWQPSLAVHVTEGVPVQVPPAQAYVSHLLEPAHEVPSGSCVCAAHTPVPGAHAPGT